ncbi:MAG: type II secretion system protein GspG [Candidatus Omnitrophica bacterium]|nr:type II secretion system protein GspG [Candidatus Omnitrophota bacterium]
MKSKNTLISLNCIRGHRGVSLFEVVLCIVIVGIFATVGGRAVTSMDDVSRFQYTLKAMETMRIKIIGNPELVQTGLRADFGYWAHGNGVPAALSNIDYRYWMTPDPYVKTIDGWGNAYTYDDGSGDDMIDITSDGADNAAGGTGFNADLDMDIDLDDFESNDVRIYCVDRRGTMLLNNSTGGDDTIDSVAVIINGVSNACSYFNGGYWQDTGLRAGPCILQVTPNAAWRTELCGDNATVTLQMPAVIYPKASFAENNMNIYEFRFPGDIETPISS